MMVAGRDFQNKVLVEIIRDPAGAENELRDVLRAKQAERQTQTAELEAKMLC